MRPFASFTLRDFLAESNRIEDIQGVSASLVEAAEIFLAKGCITRQDMIEFVSIAQPDAVIRDRRGLNVYVGNHVPPPGGPAIVQELDELLKAAASVARIPCHAYFCHQRYETLHPFTDGNGRSGRLLWLWMMGGIGRAPLGFLHHWYYQSLQFSRSPS